MDGTQSPQPSFELPQPKPSEATGVATPGNEGTPGMAQPSPERANNSGDSGSQAAPMLPSAQMPVSVPMPDPGQQPLIAATPVPPLATAVDAHDVDLIEKVWVEKAKEIVGRTRSDPHLQNKEISKFKAEYIKKRYNKDIRVSEEQK
jgi:hypothetical protein